MGSKVSNNRFTYAYTDEPHATRRKLILQKYPEIKRLMGVDEMFKWQVIALVCIQFLSFFSLRNVHNVWLLIIMAYCFGGVVNHALMLAIHELSHSMGFGISRPLANKLLAMFANLPLGFPMSVSFKKYHLEHHRYQGDEVLDVDVPTYLEASLFTSTTRKAFWCFLQPFFYTLRPLIINPKPLDQYECLNIALQLAFDLLIANTLGWHIIAYMIGGSALAMGLHPVAGHFISEHFLFDNENQDSTNQWKDRSKGGKLEHGIITGDLNLKLDENSNVKKLVNEAKPSTQVVDSYNTARELVATLNDEDGSLLVPETCSYYGPLNYVTFNVGYHVEHHDFPSIPGSRLHMLSKIAPEFYLNLNYHTSWTKVLWRYITDPKLGPHARVRRRIQRT